MKIAIDKLNEGFIEIPLYRVDDNYSPVRKMIVKILLSILFITTILCFGFLEIDILGLIGIVLLMIILILSYHYYSYLFLTTTETLVFAYSQIHLMNNQKIKWYQPVKDCNFEQLQDMETKASIIKISDMQHFTITIQYTIKTNPLKTTSILQTDNYIIQSTSDWNQLVTLLKI